MDVPLWENRFLDINVRDGEMIGENVSTEGKNGSKTVKNLLERNPLL